MPPKVKASKQKEEKKPKSNRPARADWKEGTKKKQVGVTDMTLLTKINNDAINENLEKRWKNGEIYTYIGHVLISVNPFKDLGIYTDEILKSYPGKNLLEMPPHVYAIAEGSYYHMNSYKENQCIIISGESGAGKTEAAKRIMQYIATVSGRDSRSSSIQEIKDMVLATNPLLESFGCAKTLRNNNSSRHGKYLEIQFNSNGDPVGAIITNYLLEKNRVVGQIQYERNFHIFYQLCKSASPEYQEQFGLQGPESFLYTSASNCLDVDGIDDVKDFAETINAMNVIGLQKNEQDDIFKMLAIILWLGNVQFGEGEDGNSAIIVDTDVTTFIAYLMGVDDALLYKALTSRVMETTRGGRRGSVYEVPLNVTQAVAVRDALAKAIYDNVFDWIVERINVSLKQRSANQFVIGVLDIYGFEIFDDNSFEQLCINYVNEKLQQIFIELTLKTEQEEYVREKIQWTPIDFFNNKVVCDLIEEKRPPGIFAALNDACATAHADSGAADNSFVQRLGFLSSNPHFESRGAKFLVRHYAGDVLYNIAGMTDKNKDQLSKDLLDLVDSSSSAFLTSLFPERIDKDSKKRPPTASDKIKASCNTLVTKLMQCHPSYIRTIKPNDNKSSSEYDNKRVLHQIKYLGLCENIRVRRAGFAYRQTYDKFAERFYLLSPKTGYAGDYIWNGDSKGASVAILQDCNIPKEEWQLGTSKVFIKHPETIFALEHLRDRYWHNMAIRIQRAWRNYMRYRNECATRIQRAWKKNKDSIGYLQLRDYGHSVLGGRKERRRFSLLSMRRFTGDYLAVKVNKEGQGAMLREAIGLKSKDTIVFSARVQLLVPRPMRSSKPSPRSLVMTDQNIYIVISTLTGKVLSMEVERTVSLNVVKGVSLSQLRDDWLILHINSGPNDNDPVFSCDFKTELVAHLLQRTGGRINVDISNEISYSKKGGKNATMKFIKDDKLKDDVYASHVCKVPSGEPPNSVSNPPCKRKPREVASKTPAKFVPKGGPKKIAGQMRSAGITPATNRTSTVPASAATPVAAAVPPRSKAPPPPPPPAMVPTAVEYDIKYKTLYAFQSEEAGEISFSKDVFIDILDKDENGWWLAKKDGKEGWVPSNYLEEVKIPRAVPSAPATPARRPPPTAPIQSTASVGRASGRTSQVTAAANVPKIPAAPSSNGMSDFSRMSRQLDSDDGPSAVAAPTVPAWKAELEARKAQFPNGANPPKPTLAARPNVGSDQAASPVPGNRPVIPARPGTSAKPVIPARPQGATAKPVIPGARPAPPAPPRPTGY